MSWLSKLIPNKLGQRESQAAKRGVPEGVWTKCLGCDAVLYQTDLAKNDNVCPHCSHHHRINARTRLDTQLVEAALSALNQGQGERHDALVLDAAQQLIARGAEVIALAQFSMARAATLLRQELTVPVLTTPDSAVAALKLALA